MSWAINLTGTREEVKNEILTNPSIKATVPAFISDMIVNHLQDEDTAPNGVKIEGYGHLYDGKGSYNSNFKLEITPLPLIVKV